MNTQTSLTQLPETESLQTHIFEMQAVIRGLWTEDD